MCGIPVVKSGSTVLVLMLAVSVMCTCGWATDYRVLTEAEAAAVVGSCGPGGWDCVSQIGCGADCMLFYDPNDLYHSCKAIDISYHACEDGYWWQHCEDNAGQVVCARWTIWEDNDCTNGLHYTSDLYAGESCTP